MIRNVKNIIKILLLSWICMATKCRDKDSGNCHTAVRISNYSERNIRIAQTFLSIYYPDPLNIKGFYLTASEEKYKIISGELDNSKAARSSSCMEKQFENYKPLIVYVFDADVVENTSWEVVARDYLVLKRYDLTLEDLQRLDWKITYPPTEAMKDVKMYPQYGE